MNSKSELTGELCYTGSIMELDCLKGDEASLVKCFDTTLFWCAGYTTSTLGLGNE